MPPHESLLTLSIIVPATAGVIIRPFRLSEAIWAVGGAVALMICNVLTTREALHGVAKGLDVYFFLIGMMLTAELARCEGLFDYLAAFAVEHARGSPQRLFLLVYAVGILVTVLLSNDATAIVLTPAVYTATRAAGADPCPISSRAPSSPTPRVLCCRSPIPPTWSCSASVCPICSNGCTDSRCLRLPRLR